MDRIRYPPPLGGWGREMLALYFQFDDHEACGCTVYASRVAFDEAFELFNAEGFRRRHGIRGVWFEAFGQTVGDAPPPGWTAEAPHYQKLNERAEAARGSPSAAL